MIDTLTELKAIVTWGVKEIPADLAKDSRIYTWEAFMALGKNIETSIIHTIM